MFPNICFFFSHLYMLRPHEEGNFPSKCIIFLWFKVCYLWRLVCISLFLSFFPPDSEHIFISRAFFNIKKKRAQDQDYFSPSISQINILYLYSSRAFFRCCIPVITQTLGTWKFMFLWNFYCIWIILRTLKTAFGFQGVYKTWSINAKGD